MDETFKPPGRPVVEDPPTTHLVRVFGPRPATLRRIVDGQVLELVGDAKSITVLDEALRSKVAP